MPKVDPEVVAVPFVGISLGFGEWAPLKLGPLASIDDPVEVGAEEGSGWVWTVLMDGISSSRTSFGLDRASATRFALPWT